MIDVGGGDERRLKYARSSLPTSSSRNSSSTSSTHDNNHKDYTRRRQSVDIGIRYGGADSVTAPEVVYTVNRQALAESSHFFRALLNGHFAESQLHDSKGEGRQPHIRLVFQNPWMTRTGFENVLKWCDPSCRLVPSARRMTLTEDDNDEKKKEEGYYRDLQILVTASYLLIPALERRVTQRLLRHASQSLSDWMAITEIACTPEYSGDRSSTITDPLTLKSGCLRILLSHPSWILQLAEFAWTMNMTMLVTQALSSDMLVVKNEFARYRLISEVIEQRKTFLTSCPTKSEVWLEIRDFEEVQDRTCTSCQDAIQIERNAVLLPNRDLPDLSTCKSSFSDRTPPSTPPPAVQRPSLQAFQSVSGVSSSTIGSVTSSIVQPDILLEQIHQLSTILHRLRYWQMDFSQLEHIEARQIVPISLLHQATFEARRMQSHIQNINQIEQRNVPLAEIRQIFDFEGSGQDGNRVSSPSPSIIQWRNPWNSNAGTDSFFKSSGAAGNAIQQNWTRTIAGARRMLMTGNVLAPVPRPLHSTVRSNFEPFRWTARFENVWELQRDDLNGDLTMDRISRRRWSQTIEYGGSLWNAYLSYAPSSEGIPQLGIYLHRHDDVRSFGLTHPEDPLVRLGWRDDRTHVPLCSVFHIFNHNGSRLLSFGSLDDGAAPDLYAMDQAWGYRDSILLTDEYLGEGGQLVVVIGMSLVF